MHYGKGPVVNLLQPWSNYFVAQASTAAALTGLIFVVLSFNFDHIISDDVWLGRAATGLIMLAQLIVYALVSLLPVTTASPLGWTLAGLGLATTCTLVRIVLTTADHTPAGTTPELGGRLLVSVAGSLITMIGGVLVARNDTAGPFILAAGACSSLMIGLTIAWFLLVEVRRLRR
jgi:hypothetical protein